MSGGSRLSGTRAGARIGHRAAPAVLLVVAAGSCSRGGVEDPPRLEDAEMSLAEYDFVAAERPGVWEVRTEEGVRVGRAGMTEWRVVGDLDANGALDALVVLWSSGGGSGTFMELAHFTVVGPRGEGAARWRWEDSVPLGDRVRVRSMIERDGVVELHLTEHGEDDPMCCPSIETVRSYRVLEGALSAAPP